MDYALAPVYERMNVILVVKSDNAIIIFVVNVGKPAIVTLLFNLPMYS